jgi:hypothetical protein
MSFFIKHFEGLVSMDWQTLTVLAVICALGSYFIKDYLTNPIMIVFVFPILLLFSILVQYLFMQAELYAPKKLDQWLMWTIMASICGTVIGMGLVASISAFRDRDVSKRA